MAEARKARPITERGFDAFISHAFTDKQTIVGDIYHWCENIAGMRVWYDETELHTGNITPQLGEAIADSQAGILVLTKAALETDYVEKEVSLFEVQKRQFGDFKVVILQAEQCEVPYYLQSLYRIDISETGFDASAALKLIGALHRHQSGPDTIRRPPVYLARGSRPTEIAKGQAATSALKSAGFRVIRDFPQAEMDMGRLRRLIRNCCGMVALVPFRMDEARPTSEAILDEIRLALDEDVPVWLIVDEGLDRALLPSALTTTPAAIASLDSDISDLARATTIAEHFRAEIRRRPSQRGAHCFFGHKFNERKGSSIYETARKCVEAVSGLPCYSGDELRGTIMLPEIAKRIVEAEFCIFDITNEDGSIALNTCIEAGIAMGAAQIRSGAGDRTTMFADFHIIARGPRREPPFMFQAVQVSYYNSDLELLGLLRSICLRYRRISE